MQRLRTPVKLRNAILYAEDKTDGAVVLFEEQAVDQAAVAVEQGRAKYTTPAAYLCGWAARALPICLPAVARELDVCGRTAFRDRDQDILSAAAGGGGVVMIVLYGERNRVAVDL